MSGSKKSENQTNSILYSQKVAPYVFILPFVITLLVFFLYPIISSFFMSMEDKSHQFIGLENYVSLFSKSAFKKAIGNSVIYTLITCAVVVPVPMLLAVFLDSKKLLGKSFFRAVFFLPALVSVVVGGFVFRLIFGEMDTAMLNSLLKIFGAAPIKWLGGPEAWTTFFALLLLCCWRWTGVNIMYYLAGLQNIPTELYESADIDGANAWQKFIHITVPMLKPTIIYVLTISIYGGMAMFLESRMLFNAGRYPGNQGLTITGYLYQLGWNENKTALACAVGIFLLLTTLIVNLIQLRITGFFKKEGHK